MLKRVALPDIEVGMFIHKLEGSWFKHPFWKSRFLLDDPTNLEQLQTSELDGVIIDTSKGKDVASKVSEVASDEPKPIVQSNSAPAKSAGKKPSGRLAALKARQSIDLASTEPTSTAAEVNTAQVVAQRVQKAVALAFIDVRLGKFVSLRKVEPLVQEIYASVRRNSQAFGGLMRCKLNNGFVYRHALSVSALMVSLARQMKLSTEEVHEAGLAGLFLDIGTNRLPRDAAAANGDFSHAAPDVWQQHVPLGEKVLRDAGTFSEPVIQACLQHHERMDGSGFPNGVKGRDLSLIARMAAICDAFDYLLVDGKSSTALDPSQAIIKLREMEGAFDPDVLRAFIESVGNYPVGSFVRLRSDRLAMVVDEDPKKIDRPVVCPFFSLVTNERITPKPIALASGSEQDEIVEIADLSGLALPEPGQLRELIYMQTYKVKD